MKKLWFVSKRYGWGWTPATWEGWFVIAAYLACTFLTVAVIEHFARIENNAVMIFLPLICIYTCVLFFICVRTGEKPRWRWGK